MNKKINTDAHYKDNITNDRQISNADIKKLKESKIKENVSQYALSDKEQSLINGAF